MLRRLEGDVERSASSGEGQEPMPQDLAELKQALREAVRRLEDETSRLAHVADRLEARIGAPPAGEPAAEPAPMTPPEPQFQPVDHPVDVVIAAVPGFQGLMDAQRGLSALPAVEGASVHRYQNGEASLSVTLRSPLTVQEIVEGLQLATGHQLVIEEARPEAQRLRLRFVGSLRPEPQAGG